MGITEDGTDWSMDIDNITEMCSQLDSNLAFIMCTGDLAHAMPVDEGQNNAGSLPALRPAQVRFSKRFLPRLIKNSFFENHKRLTISLKQCTCAQMMSHNTLSRAIGILVTRNSRMKAPFFKTYHFWWHWQWWHYDECDLKSMTFRLQRPSPLVIHQHRYYHSNMCVKMR